MAKKNRKFHTYQSTFRYFEKLDVDNPGRYASTFLNLYFRQKTKNVLLREFYDLKIFTEAEGRFKPLDAYSVRLGDKYIILIDDKLKKIVNIENEKMTSFTYPRTKIPKELDRKIYENLRQKLKREEFESPGQIATYLFYVFCHNSGRASAETANLMGACEPGAYKALRTKLQIYRYISYDDRMFHGTKWEIGPAFSKYWVQNINKLIDDPNSEPNIRNSPEQVKIQDAKADELSGYDNKWLFDTLLDLLETAQTNGYPDIGNFCEIKEVMFKMLDDKNHAVEFAENAEKKYRRLYRFLEELGFNPCSLVCTYPRDLRNHLVNIEAEFEPIKVLHQEENEALL